MMLCSNRAAQSIFRYLVARSTHSATSDTLKELFWPQDEPAVAQRKLHHAISALRSSLSNPVLTDPHSIHIICKNGIYFLDTSVEMHTDVDEFLDCYHTGQQRSEERMALYERACQLYIGPFLTEEIYADWSALRREQLSKAYLTMCRGLADYYSSIKCYEEAEKWATAIIKENPCDETAHQQLMQIYAVQGRRSEAIQQYHHCEHILREELGVQPMLGTTALLRKILMSEGV